MKMPHEIIPHLLLGDAKDAEHMSADIKLVVNCTKNLPFYSPDTQQIRIAVDDSPDDGDAIIRYWKDPALFETITNHIMQGHDVLVHCQMGRQRSASTIAALLIKTCGWSLRDTIAFIKTKKRDAFFPDVNFMAALTQFTSFSVSVGVWGNTTCLRARP
jgi:hypothetical protein